MGENELIYEDIYEKFVEEIVIVTRGKHKGRIAYCDDIHSDKKCYISFGDFLITLAYEITIPAKSLRIATTDDLLTRYHNISRLLSLNKVPYEKRVTLLEELALINDALTNRMINNMFFQASEGKKVFISHSSKDKTFAKTLATDLRDKGHSPWLDEWKILAGQSIPQEISKGLKESDFVVVLLSQSSVNSQWVEREWQDKYWDEINSKKTKVIPILIEECEIPHLLRTKKYVDFTYRYNDGLEEILRALNQS